MGASPDPGTGCFRYGFLDEEEERMIGTEDDLAVERSCRRALTSMPVVAAASVPFSFTAMKALWITRPRRLFRR
jgi:hypothetical protein